jgi:putative ABC transport system permease protein
MEDPENVLALHIVQVLVTMLLVVVCVNVAILVYARTATRQAEIAVRSALGASRRRIIGQLFMEALVLAAAAAVVGLGITTIALQVEAAVEQMVAQLPFWVTFDLSSSAVLYVVGVTLLAAAIVGVVPGLKATGRHVQTGLRLVGPGGSGMRLGRTWTLLIVAQVAFAVALLPGAMFNAWSSLRYGIADPGFAAREFLTAQLVMDRVTPPNAAAAAPAARDFTARYADRSAELLQRVRAAPGIGEVTYALDVPGQEATVWIEAEGVAMPTEPADYSVRSGTSLGLQVRFNHVDLDFFDVFDVSLLIGRGFRSGDADPAATAVIVNRAFVQKFLVDGNVLGRRIRYVGTSGDARPEHVTLGRWHEIVGVVSDFPAKATESGLADSKVYHAAVAGQLYPVNLAIRVRGSAPAAFSGRLRELTAAVDPNLQLREILSMDEVLRKDQGMLQLIAAGLAIVTLSVVLLCSAGIYAMMSFTVSQRRKEIGIRAARGAGPRRIIGSIFSRALGQLAMGAVAGVIIVALLEQITQGELMRGNGAVVLPLVAMLMMLVGLFAALGPARRGLRVHPTEALREP